MSSAFWKLIIVIARMFTLAAICLSITKRATRAVALPRTSSLLLESPTRNAARGSLGKRRSWFTWKENKVPEVIFEFTSKETREEDLWTKRGLYQWLGVKEYFLFDPLDEYLKPRLQGFRLTDGVYQAIPEINYGLQSESLGLTLNANGNRLALTETATGKRLLQLHELQEAYQSAEKEIEKLRDELERLKKQK
ncbi:MAG: Uma2 family endonuclease [Chloroflexi bacterium]|nr:Uma2 family endonuclease [Chloroflexota bacterium]